MPLAKLVKRYLSLFIIIHKKAPQLEKMQGLTNTHPLLKFNINHSAKISIVVNTVNTKAKQL